MAGSTYFIVIYTASVQFTDSVRVYYVENIVLWGDDLYSTGMISHKIGVVEKEHEQCVHMINTYAVIFCNSPLFIPKLEYVHENFNHF